MLVAFRDRLLATIRAARSVLETPGVMVVGSEVPSLLEPGAAGASIVSQHLDIGIPVARHAAVKERLGGLDEFEQSVDEPSVWTPRSPNLLELNFVGIDPARDPAEAYVLEDERLPLLVFGALSLVSLGSEIEMEGTRVPLSAPAGLLLLPPGSRRSRAAMTPSLERRLRQLRSRVLVRARDYRQRRHARGVWFRLRRVLADASEVYGVTREEAQALVREGHPAEPVGEELEPQKLIVFAPAARVAQIESAQPLAVRFSAELLAAECLVLVPFATGTKAVR